MHLGIDKKIYYSISKHKICSHLYHIHQHKFMQSQFLQLNIFNYKKINKDIRIIKEVLQLLASLHAYNLADTVLIDRY